MSSNADAAGGNPAGQVIPNAGALGQANPGLAGQAIPGGAGGEIIPPNVSTMALIKFRALLKDVPQDSLAEATVLLTECLLEQAHVPKPPHWNILPPRPFGQWREEAELLGAQFVPAAAGGPLPQQVRVIVDEVTTSFRVAAQPGQQGVQGQQQGQLLVVSVEAQERAEKFLTLPGGIRVRRAPDEKTAWMFPHPWITICVT